MKTLILCRHGKSDWPMNVADIDRPLKDRGIEDSKYLGALLKGQGLLPDRMISSPANRARTTARLVAQELGYISQIPIVDSIYYEGSGSLLNMVQEFDAHTHTAMIFGHNPTMENTVRFLLQADKRYEMPTCGMACFESYGSWDRFAEMAQLRWLLVPRMVRKD